MVGWIVNDLIDHAPRWQLLSVELAAYAIILLGALGAYILGLHFPL